MGKLISDKWFRINFILSVIAANFYLFSKFDLLDLKGLASVGWAGIAKLLLIITIMTSAVIFDYLLLLIPNHLINIYSEKKNILIVKYSFIILLPHLLWMTYKSWGEGSPVTASAISIAWSALLFTGVLKFYSTNQFDNPKGWLKLAGYAGIAIILFSLLYLGQFIITMLVSAPVYALSKYI